MNNIKNYKNYITEMKSERKIVQDLARHLSFDKEVIKYLNTSRSKRKEGWRELLARKLHGSQLDYLNYITKNMVADYNPQITGYINVNGDKYSDSTDDASNPYHGMTLGEIVNDIADRVSDIETVLGIDHSNEKSIDVVSDKLKEIGFEPDWIDDDGHFIQDDDSDKKEEEEEESEDSGDIE